MASVGEGLSLGHLVHGRSHVSDVGLVDSGHGDAAIPVTDGKGENAAVSSINTSGLQMAVADSATAG